MGLLNPSVICISHADAAKRQAGTGSSIGKDGKYKADLQKAEENIFIRAVEVISNASDCRMPFENGAMFFLSKATSVIGFICWVSQKHNHQQ